MTRQFLNTLYVGTEGAHARLEDDNVRVDLEGERLLAVPLHHLGSIVLFGVCTASASLMMRCADDGRAFVLLDQDRKAGLWNSSRVEFGFREVVFGRKPRWRSSSPNPKSP